MRSPEDLRAFIGEPGAFDPLLLAAGEINPVFSGSTFQGFALDPFPPVGTRIGSFLLFTTIETDVDYNNNLFASPVAVGDTALEVRPAARWHPRGAVMLSSFAPAATSASTIATRRKTIARISSKVSVAWM